MKRQIVRTAKGCIEYTLSGNGPVVLVLHGTSSDCSNAIDPAALLEAGYSVLMPSRPGYGQTPVDTGRNAAEAAETMVSLLNILNIDTCPVIAISGGGPTGIALAADYPQRVSAFVLIAAVSDTEHRPSEPEYQNQSTFYGPFHGLIWAMLGLFSHLNPRQMARQTLAIFSTHDPEDALRRLSIEDVENLCRFYRRSSSRTGAVNDAAHTVDIDLIRSVSMPTLIIHSREDRAVPFHHAEWSLHNIPGAVLHEAGYTGHFFWIGPDYPGINRRLVDHLCQTDGQFHHERVTEHTSITQK